jgi:hypothetical protein
MMIFCKQSSGRVGPYTAALPNSKRRDAWSPISGCEMIRLARKTEVVEYVRFKNIENLQKEFRIDLLNMFIRSSTQFDRFCTKFQVDKRIHVLCIYISLLTRSCEFRGYKEELHSEDGFDLDGSGIQENNVTDSGGSLVEFLQFKTLAKMHAIVISDGVVGAPGDKVQSRVVQNKRITDFFQSSCPPKKLSKTEAVEQGFNQECSDKSGLEQRLISEYVGWGSICIDSLKCNDSVCLPINQSEVGVLADSMLKRFDPSQAVLIVAEDVEGGNGEYWVLHGNHRMLAFKQLDSAKKFQDLPGIEQRSIQCYIVGSGCRSDPALGVYCQIRSNDLAAEFQTKPEMHELIYVFNDINKNYKDVEKTTLIMDRLAKLRKVSRDDLTSLKKIFAWPQENLEQLIQVLQVYEKYQTIDSSGTRNRSRIQRGEKLPLTRAMLRDLGKCNSEYFGSVHQGVISGEISLKQLLEKNSKLQEIEKTKAAISKEAGFEKFTALQQKYPEKVTDEVVKSFSGALVKGKKRNLQGQMLKYFVKNLDQPNSSEEPVKTETLEDIKDLKLEAYDTVVMQVHRDDMDFVENAIDLVSVSRKVNLAVMLILENEQDFKRSLCKLGYWEEQTNIQVRSVFFENDSTEADNLTFSVMFGRFCTLASPLRSLYKNLKLNLKDIVEAVSPPAAKIAFVSMHSKFCAMIHDESSNNTNQIIYLAPHIMLNNLKLKVFRDTESVIDSDASVVMDSMRGDKRNLVDGDEDCSESEDSDSPEEVIEKQSSTSSTKYKNE